MLFVDKSCLVHVNPKSNNAKSASSSCHLACRRFSASSRRCFRSQRDSGQSQWKPFHVRERTMYEEQVKDGKRAILDKAPCKGQTEIPEIPIITSKSGQMGREPFCKVPEPFDPFFPRLFSRLRATQLFVALTPCPPCLQFLAGAAVRFCFDKTIRSSSACRDYYTTHHYCFFMYVCRHGDLNITNLCLLSTAPLNFMNMVLYIGLPSTP